MNRGWKAFDSSSPTSGTVKLKRIHSGIGNQDSNAWKNLSLSLALRSMVEKSHTYIGVGFFNAVLWK
jgi:hypothetical protein